MTKLLLSISSPQLEHLDPNDPDKMEFYLNRPEYNKALAQKLLSVHTSYWALGYDFIRTSLTIGKAVALLNQEQVQLLIVFNLEHSNIINKTVAVDKVAWSNKNNSNVRGLVRRFYLEHLLPRYGIVCSSDVHRERGKQMWLKLCEEALVKKYHVYCFTVDKRFIEIRDKAELTYLEPKIWGTTDAYLNSWIFISLKELNVDYH